jgi:hypothetical protein
MNNENKARIRSAVFMVYVTILTMLFGINSEAHAEIRKAMVYNKYIIYINKYNNLVNIKDIINIDYKDSNKRIKDNTLYLINDLRSRNTFKMPAYSVKLNLKSRVDDRVFISRLANALKSHETGGVGAYTRKSHSSSACGAYQYMPSTWNNYMGYKSACDAPEWVQDGRIISELKYSYEKYHDWKKVVAAHLSPARAKDPSTWNKPIHGNPTVQQYIDSVFRKANISIA